MTARAKLHLDHLLATLGGATVLIVLASAGAIAWLLSVSSASLDQTQEAGEQRLLASVIENYRRTQSKHVTDFGSWNELYEYWNGPRRPRWEHDNLGPYLSSTFGVDQVFVTGRDGRTVYAYPREGPARPEIASHIATLAFQAERPKDQVPVSGFAAVDGVPSLIVASTIRDSALSQPSQYTLIEARELNAALLHRIEHDYGLSQLRVEQGQGGGLALADLEGRRSPYRLTWQTSGAAHRNFLHALPAFAAVGVAALGAVLVLTLVWWKVFEAARAAERRMRDAELEASETRMRAAEETSRSKSAFIANMSHELRTPLNAVIGFSELLLSSPSAPIDGEKQRDYAAAIHNSGRRLLGIINDILQVSRIEAGKFEPAMQPVPLNDALIDSVDLIEIEARKRGIALELSLDKNCGSVLADRSALQQILANILSNAVKFSDENATVAISTRRDAAGCEVRIEDHGCGMPEETLRSIGKPFVQAEGPYSRKYQGAGLGLTIAHLLARTMGATIQLQSSEGVGTTVVLRLACSAGLERAA
jgi:signal transduction histidine kinase